MVLLLFINLNKTYTIGIILEHSAASTSLHKWPDN